MPCGRRFLDENQYFTELTIFPLLDLCILYYPVSVLFLLVILFSFPSLFPMLKTFNSIVVLTCVVNFILSSYLCFMSVVVSCLVFRFVLFRSLVSILTPLWTGLLLFFFCIMCLESGYLIENVNIRGLFCKSIVILKFHLLISSKDDEFLQSPNYQHLFLL